MRNLSSHVCDLCVLTRMQPLLTRVQPSFTRAKNSQGRARPSFTHGLIGLGSLLNFPSLILILDNPDGLKKNTILDQIEEANEGKTVFL